MATILKLSGGPPGVPGTAATVAVGTVSTGAAGSDAAVTNAGTSAAAVLNFIIPRGDTGPKGDTGDTGPTGPSSETTASILEKIGDGSTIGAEYLPDALTISSGDPNALVITGITDPAGSSPLTVPKVADVGGFASWQLAYDGKTLIVFRLGGDWVIYAQEGGPEYIYYATKASSAGSPVGLTGWTVTEGAGQPVVGRFTAEGSHIGQLLRVIDTEVWYRWTGTEWALDAISTEWDDITGRPSTFTPTAHKSSHATGGSDPLTPGDIGAATAAHTQAASTISDSTAAGRAVLTAAGESKLLRAARVNGHNSLVSLPSKLWRLNARLSREAASIPGSPVATPRFRVLALGDSTTCNPIALAQGFFGFGGGHSQNIWAWTKEGGGSTAILNSEDFTKFPGGQFVELNAGTANRTYIEQLNYAPEFQSVFVRYWASSAGGSFKVQYKVNKAGAWTDCNGTYDVSTGGGSINAGTKVVNTNNGGAGRYAQARFTLPAMDYYHIRIQAVTGAGNAPVQISDVTFNAGGWFFDPPPISYAKTSVAGAADVHWGLGGKFLEEFVTTPQAVWDDAMDFADPHLIVFKWANGATVAALEANWETYAGRILSAAPNATFVVCGQHPHSSNPTRLDEGRMAVDDWMRDWCSENDCIFVDVRQSFPAFTDSPGSADDLWVDGIHIYGGSPPDWGGGDRHVEGLVWEAIRPGLSQQQMGMNAGANITNVLPGFPTEIRLNNPSVSDAQAGFGKNLFSFVSQPRRMSYVAIRDTNCNYYPSQQYWANTAGFGKNVSDSITNYAQNGLMLIGDGIPMATITTRGGNFGYIAEWTRSVQGWRFLNTDAGTPTLVAQSKAGQTGAVLAVDINATISAAGSTMWGWYADGRVVYDGTTSNANKTTFTYAEPAAALTIHTPVCATAGSGTNARVIGVIPSYANQAAGNAAVGVAEVFYAEDVGKVFTRLS